MKWLYKYPQGAYPYDKLVRTNRHRRRTDFEYELFDTWLFDTGVFDTGVFDTGVFDTGVFDTGVFDTGVFDTGVFEVDRYFDVSVEYAKHSPEDILIRISVANRGSEAATLHVLPTLWFRNTWTWWPERAKPTLKQVGGSRGLHVIAASHAELGDRWLYVQGAAALLFTENDTNTQRIAGKPNARPYVKDGIDNYVVHGQRDAVNPASTGTKMAAHHQMTVAAGTSAVFRLRLTNSAPEQLSDPFRDFELTVRARRDEADDFYRAITPPAASEDAARVMRQALAGMLWSKQYYTFDADKWLEEHGADRFALHPKPVRNHDWSHMINDHVISMPDKWEYRWYAAWDLAFHAIALAGVDVDLAKQQLDLLLREIYLHPSGQIPAYEWNFSDVNPPVHAWASIFVYRTEQALRGEGDVAFLKRAFGKLLANFTWWVNRKDRFGKNVFEGGFLGLDNIGVFDRSAPLPTGGHLEQADGTAWMALFCQNMLEMAVEIAGLDPTYQDLAGKFTDHLLWIASAMNRVGGDGMWDERDGFYYDVLRLPDGNATRLKVRSMVGLLPLCATTVIEPWMRERVPVVVEHFQERIRRMPELVESLHPTGPGHFGYGDRGILALVNPTRLRRLLGYLLDENEFLSPYGIRSLSRWHEKHPYVFRVHGDEYRVGYLPAESDTGMFGGNSNWRGPIWFPVNVLLIRALLQFYGFYGDTLKVECPTRSGQLMNLFEVSSEIATRLTRIFLRDEHGRRPVYGGTTKFQTDPHWRDHLLFYEYFHGDNGAGLGASHQTGWTGLVATLIELFGRLDGPRFLEVGRQAVFAGGR
jgi:Mannosylglycerate hydrolase MGH1-like glycoside hydrolase domain